MRLLVIHVQLNRQLYQKEASQKNYVQDKKTDIKIGHLFSSWLL